MTLAKKYLATFVGALALFALLSVPSQAMDNRMFLEASVTPTSIESLSSIEASNDDVSTSETSEAEDEPVPQAEGTTLWFMFKALLDSLVFAQSDIAYATSDVSTSASSLASVRIRDIGSTSAVVAWSPSVFSNVRVYYSSTTPVVVSELTNSVSPWKPWRRFEVALKGLSPNTVYFYKVVAETNLGMITSAEASFKTISR